MLTKATGVINPELKEQAEEYRNILIEAIADLDEEIMVKYLDGEEISADELKKAKENGVVPLAYDCAVAPDSIEISKPVLIKL